ncbi:leucine-rich_repeat domain-containing protein [Hexamita inflata]|uniref:Partial n=1 Tax=Hexamita inflata TaxID=28002 RepID=A0AA86QAB5_9EUKA|nr:leucine-rich repeat domain-containing protein [Hexamita inflata]CAI9948427.1 leucine-rich repeat domain-containing protein [Hexamita inflata]
MTQAKKSKEDTKVELQTMEDLQIFIQKNFPSTTNLKKVTELVLSLKCIHSIEALRQITQLKELQLQSNQIDDISPLQNLMQVKKLFLQSNKIKDLSPLKNLVQLEQLNISSNQISSLQDLRHLVNLVNLYANNNQIEDLRPLKPLIWVQNLELNSNQIQNIQPLIYMVSLCDVSLQSNKISALPVFPENDKLYGLDLSFNSVCDVNLLSELSILSNVNLERNQVIDISPLEYMELYNFNIIGNKVKSASKFNPSGCMKFYLYQDQQKQTKADVKFYQRLKAISSSQRVQFNYLHNKRQHYDRRIKVQGSIHTVRYFLQKPKISYGELKDKFQTGKAKITSKQMIVIQKLSYAAQLFVSMIEM